MEYENFPDIFAYALNELDHYREPLCYELAGRCFQVCLDTGVTYALHFLNEEMLAWGERSHPMRWDAYACLKLDDDTYLVNADLCEAEFPTCVSIILDLNAALVTAVITKTGTAGQDGLCDKVVFGAVKVPGLPLNLLRHGYSPDLDGHVVLWRCAPNCEFVHTFWGGQGLGISLYDPSSSTKRSACFIDSQTCVIKVREDVYLIFFPIRSSDSQEDRLLMLADMNAVRSVGRSFSSRRQDSRSVLFSAFGAFLKPMSDMDAQSVFSGKEAGK